MLCDLQNHVKSNFNVSYLKEIRAKSKVLLLDRFWMFVLLNTLLSWRNMAYSLDKHSYEQREGKREGDEV